MSSSPKAAAPAPSAPAPASVASAAADAAAARAPLELLPTSVAVRTLLPFVRSADLLAFRAVSRSLYRYVHGHDVRLAWDDSDCNGGVDEEEGNDYLWRLALSRDFGFALPDGDKDDDDDDDGDDDDDDGNDHDEHKAQDTPPGADRLFLRTIRYRPTRTEDQNRYSPGAETGRSFVETGEVYDAPSAFLSWKNWAKFRQQYALCALDVDDPRDTSIAVRINAPYFLRASAMWSNIESWCRQHSPGIGSFGSELIKSFEPGCATNIAALFPVSDREGTTHSESCDVAADCLQAIWSFYGGQSNRTGRPRFPFDGLFGGYSAYNAYVCTRMLCCRSVIASIIESNARNAINIPFASNPMNVPKDFLVDRATGRVLCEQNVHAGKRMPCNVLSWLETYSTRLLCGIYETGELVPDFHRANTEAILLYPTVQDQERTSRAVTRGVEVVASAVDAHGMAERCMRVYSIRIRLLGPEEDGYISPSERGFQTCQLRSRHWIIAQGDDTEPQHVRGDGVVGQYPLLRAEGGYDAYEGQTANTANMIDLGLEGPFVYQSCTEESTGGKFEGYLQFIPGSLRNPTGEPFDVRVAPISLEEEDVSY